MQTRKSGIPTQ